MAKTPTMQDIKKQHFELNDLEAGNEAANAALALVEIEQGLTNFNFDPEAGFPPNCMMAIIPLNKRNKETNSTVCIGVCIGAVPTLEAIAATEGGQAFINTTAINAVVSKLANAARPRDTDSVAASLPLTVHDFIVNNQPEGLMKAFRKFASSYVKLLKSKGMRLMTEATLREVLQSAEFAKQQFPKVPQASWETILDSMIGKAVEAGLVAGQMDDWKATRDTAGLPIKDEIDLSGLDFDAIGVEDTEKS